MSTSKIYWIGLISCVFQAIFTIPYLMMMIYIWATGSKLDSLWGEISNILSLAQYIPLMILVRERFYKNDLMISLLIFVLTIVFSMMLTGISLIDDSAEDIFSVFEIISLFIGSVAFLIFSIKAMSIKTDIQPYWKIFCITNIVTCTVLFTIILLPLAIFINIFGSIMGAFVFSRALKDA